MPDLASTQTLFIPNPRDAYYKTNVIDPPYWFRDRQIRMIELEDIYMEGKDGVLYKDSPSCLMFSGDHACLQIIQDEHFVLQSTATIVEQRCSTTVGCADLVQNNQGNYYHFLIEGVGKLLLFRKSLPEEVYYVVPETARQLYAQIIPLLGLSSDRFIYYNHEPRSKRLNFKRLFVMDYEGATDFNDTWSVYQPPRHALQLLAATIISTPPIAKWLSQQEKSKIVYVSRRDAGVRIVQHEELLIEALEKEFGEEMIDLFVGKTMPIEDQIKMFANARMIIGPHGAAMSNLVFCRPQTIVIQFPLAPLVDTCFLHISAAMDLNLYLYHPISSYYYGNYNITPDMVQPFMDFVIDLYRNQPIPQQHKLLSKEEL